MMISGARELLYWHPTNQAEPLFGRLRSAGWNVSVARSAAEARNMIERRDIHVGLAHLDDDPGAYGDMMDMWPNSPEVEWVAMLDPRSLRSPRVSRLISERFYDYHTMPADVNRLLFSLGHAYGMATVSRRQGDLRDAGAALQSVHEPVLTLSRVRAQAEQSAIMATLLRTGHNVSRAARELEVSRVTLYRLMKKYRIGP
jgi:DNA-binding NtrC family response regulator